MRRRLAAAALGAALLPMAGGGRGSGAAVAAPCAVPNYRVVADAAPQANFLFQGTTVDVPVAYSHLEHETVPQYLFAEGGSFALGPIEGTVLQPAELVTLLSGFLPVPLPPDVLPVPPIEGAPTLPDPPGRSTSAFPGETLAGERTNTWGLGRSRAVTGPDRAAASSDSGPGIGGASSVRSTLDCDRLVVEAEWTVRLLELPGGARLGQLGQRTRIEVGPTGPPEVTVETIALDPALAPLDLGGLLDAVPDDQLGDGFRPAGQDLDVAGPEVDVADGRATVRSSPLRVRFVRPDAPQGVEARVGYLDVSVERLPSPPAPPALGAPAVTGSVAALPPLPGLPVVRPARPATPPAAAPPAAGALVVDRTRPGPAVPWAPPVAVVALVVAWWRVADARRHRWPTAHWTLTHLETAGRRFVAGYLRW